MSIYKEVAEAALKNWYGKQPEEIEKIFLSISNHELESHNDYGVWGTDSMIAGIKAYAKGIECYEILNLPTSKLREMLLNEDPFLTITLENATTKKISEINSDAVREFKQKLYVDCLEAIHDKWAVSSVKKFFDEKRQKKQYMHLPLELIGWKEVENDLLFLRPIVESAGLNADMADVEKEYNYRRDIFKNIIFENGVKSFARQYYDRLTQNIENFELNSEKKEFTLEKFSEIVNALNEAEIIKRVSQQSSDRINAFYQKPNKLDYISPQTKTALLKITDTINTYIDLQKQNPTLNLESSIDSMREVFIETQKVAILEILNSFKKILDDIRKITPTKEINKILQNKKSELIDILKDFDYILNSNKELKKEYDKLITNFEDPLILKNNIKEQNIR